MKANKTMVSISRHWYQRPVAWAFVFLFLLVTLISLVAINSLRKIEEEYVKATQIHVDKLRLLDEMVHHSRERSVLLRDIVIAEDPFRQDEIIQHHAILATRYLLARNNLDKLNLTAEERAFLDEIKLANKDGYDLQKSILSHAVKGDRKKALKLVEESLGPNRERIYPAMLGMKTLLVNASTKAADDAKASMSSTRIALMWLYSIVLMLGILIAWVAYILDRKYLMQLDWHAKHDGLTGLLNRFQFEYLLSDATGLLKDTEKSSVVIYIDIDQFNLINNTSGFEAGDEFLRQIATSLRAIFGPQADIGRVGGDQFAVLMYNTDRRTSISLANSFLKYVNDYQFMWLDRTYNVTVSIGIVSSTEQGSDKEDLLSAAYLACDIAKAYGGNRVETYKCSEQNTQIRRMELDWASRLQQAMLDERLILFKQGIKSIEKNSLVHSEILLRLEEDGGDIVPASQFILAAERYNLITELDLYVVKRTLEFMTSDPNQGSYSINLSGASLGNKKFAHRIIGLITESGVDAEKICFEVTETAAITNKTMAIQFMNILHGIGCHFFLDDFGSGLSSFGYLRQLPIDIVKIDNKFTRNMTLDPANLSVILAINTIAHAFGLKTVAEGVEDQVQLNQLAEIGVDYCQGYHIEIPHRLMAA